MKQSCYRSLALTVFIITLSSVRAYPLLGLSKVEDRPLYLLEKLIYEEVNEVRKQYNLPELQWASDVAYVARQHSKDMGVKQYFAHENKKGGMVSERLANNGIVFSTSAENIFKCKNYPDVVEESVKGWMDSPGHRENILNEQVTETGVGVYEVEGENEYYITQNFIKRAPRFVPSPKHLTEKEIGEIFDVIRNTISEAGYINSDDVLKNKIAGELRKEGFSVEKDFVIKGYLTENRPSLTLKADLRVNKGLIVKFTNIDFETTKELFGELINPQSYSAVVLIRRVGRRTEYIFIKGDETQNTESKH